MTNKRFFVCLFRHVRGKICNICDKQKICNFPHFLYFCLIKNFSQRLLIWPNFFVRNFHQKFGRNFCQHLCLFLVGIFTDIVADILIEIFGRNFQSTFLYTNIEIIKTLIVSVYHFKTSILIKITT